jgi:glycosyltransferase involved in cell wall biosynthesis
MATVLVVTSSPPLVEGGHLVIARCLEQALIDAGHRASIVTTPSNRFGRQASAYAANWLTDVGMTGGGDRVDQVISLRYPSYAVRHRVHVSWLNHTMREYYELWDDFAGGLSPQGRLKESVRRRLMHAADTYLLRHNVTHLFAQSRTIQERLTRWNHVASTVLHPPPPPRAYRCDRYGDYLLVASRLAPLKRIDLVLRALAEPSASGVRCVIVGEGEDEARLRQMTRDLGLSDRVVMTGRLDDAALLDQLAGCRAVVFVPNQEDYGFVTGEAFAAGKPVITCRDSGGPTELVRSGQNGWVVEPTPAGVAAACAEAMSNATLAEQLGTRGRQDIGSLTWAHVVKTLVVAS